MIVHVSKCQNGYLNIWSNHYLDNQLFIVSIILIVYLLNDLSIELDEKQINYVIVQIFCYTSKYFIKIFLVDILIMIESP